MTNREIPEPPFDSSAVSMFDPKRAHQMVIDEMNSGPDEPIDKYPDADWWGAKDSNEDAPSSG